MIIYADSGSTKCDWVAVDKNGKTALETKTKGLNPSILNSDQILKRINEANELVGLGSSVEKILFFGAGCNNIESKLIVEEALGKVFPFASINIDEDTVIAVYGSKLPRVICILGTGSNSCYFDGNQIHNRIHSMGYLVMDDGGGSYFGRLLIRAFYYNKMPIELKVKFSYEYELDKNYVLDHIYRKENPNAHLASYSRFLIENRLHPYIKKIIHHGIKEMFENLLEPYHKELQSAPLQFIGSMAYFLQQEIMEEANTRGYRVKSFTRKPIDSIIARGSLKA